MVSKAEATENFYKGLSLALAEGKELAKPPDMTDILRVHERINAPTTLDKIRDMSIGGKIEKMKQQMLDDVFVLRDLALLGQSSIFYAKYNVGKTLITLWLLREAIESGEIDPGNVFYINVDDDMKGAITKGEFAKKLGFQMLVDGVGDFEIKDVFHGIIPGLIQDKQARDAILILDTLTSFVDTMSKTAGREFGQLIKTFSNHGGTSIALGHTNKHNDKDTKKPIPEGTADIANNANCIYTMEKLSEEEGVSTVEFERLKKRGDNALRATFQYTARRGMSWIEILNSVKRLDEGSAEEARERKKVIEFHNKHAEIISIATEVIREADGLKNKGDLIKETHQRCKEQEVNCKYGINTIRGIFRFCEGESYADGYRWTGKQLNNGWAYVLIEPVLKN